MLESSGIGSISEVLPTLQAGDVLRLGAGRFSGPNNCGLSLVLAASAEVRIFGQNSVIDCTGVPGRILNIRGGKVELEGIYFVGGSEQGGKGGCVAVTDTALQVSDTVFANCSAHDGGAMLVSGVSRLTAVRSRWEHNHAARNGGGISVEGADSSVILKERTTFAHNSAGNEGGAVWLFGASAESSAGVEFVHNEAVFAGGAIMMEEGATLGATGTLFERNAALSSGGTISVRLRAALVLGAGVVMQYNLAAVVGGCISARSEAHVSIENARFEDNTAHAWGGVLSAVDGVSVTLGQGVQMLRNVGGFGAGAFYAEGPSTEMVIAGADILFQYNHALYGGAGTVVGGGLPAARLRVLGTAASPVTFDGNTALGAANSNGGALIASLGAEVFLERVHVSGGGSVLGGAFSGYLSTWELRDSTLANNTAYNGGAFHGYYADVLRFNRTLFVGNNAAGGFGGALEGNTLTASGTASTFAGNTAAFGGAISGEPGCTIGLDSTLFEGNRAGSGGAIGMRANAAVTAEACTFARCSATEAGGAIVAEESSLLRLVDVEVRECGARVGGGLAAKGRLVTIAGESSAFARNSASEGGGAIYAVGPVVLEAGPGDTTNGPSAVLEVSSNVVQSGNGGGILAVGSNAVLQVDFGARLRVDGNEALSGNGGGLALSEGASLLRAAEVCESCSAPEHDGWCTMGCMSRGCSWDQGDCTALFQDAGAQYDDTCPRAGTAGEVYCVGGAHTCNRNCFNQACDWHVERAACSERKPRLSTCPLFDAAALQSLSVAAQEKAVRFVHGGTAQGRGRCMTPCQDPVRESVPGQGYLELSSTELEWGFIDAQRLQRSGANNVQSGEDTVELSIQMAVQLARLGQPISYLVAHEQLAVLAFPHGQHAYGVSVQIGDASVSWPAFAQCQDNGRVYTEQQGTIMAGRRNDPDGGAYECTWTIALGEDAGSVLLEFHTFDLVPEEAVVGVYACESALCTEGSRIEVEGSPFTGSALPPAITISSGYVRVVYADTEYVRQEGFRASWRPVSATLAAMPLGVTSDVAVTASTEGVASLYIGGALRSQDTIPLQQRAFEGKWGVALGRSHPGSFPSGYLHGTIRAVRFWAVALSAVGLEEGKRACSELTSDPALTHCLDFQGSEPPTDVQLIRGDQHLPWCLTRRDDGKLVEFAAAASEVQRSEVPSWGYCAAEGEFDLPLSGFDHDKDELRAVLGATGLDMDSCAFTSVIFQDNSALQGSGGAVYQDGCNEGEDAKGRCFFSGSEAGRGVGRVVFLRNSAEAGGGVYTECTSIGASCARDLEKEMGLPVSTALNKLLWFQDNTAARYGSDVATMAASLHVIGHGPSAYIEACESEIVREWAGEIHTGCQSEANACASLCRVVIAPSVGAIASANTSVRIQVGSEPASSSEPRLGCKRVEATSQAECAGAWVAVSACAETLCLEPELLLRACYARDAATQTGVHEHEHEERSDDDVEKEEEEQEGSSSSSSSKPDASCPAHHISSPSGILLLEYSSSSSSSSAPALSLLFAGSLAGSPLAPTLAYTPGQDPLSLSLLMLDALRQPVVPSPYDRDPRILFAYSCPDGKETCSYVDRIGAMGFHDVELGTGIARTEKAQQRLSCPLVDGTPLAESTVVLSSRGIEVSLPVRCTPCSTGQRLHYSAVAGSGGSWSCESCPAGSYILRSNDPSSPCLPCPAGAVCTDGAVYPRIQGSVWEPYYELGVYRLITCPAGMQRVWNREGDPGGDFEAEAQDCRRCTDETEYIVHDSDTCQPCPLGAACRQSTFQARVPGSRWEITAGGAMRLTHCPPGFIIVRVDVVPGMDHCFECPENRYHFLEANYAALVLVSSSAGAAVAQCLECPPGGRCPGGSVVKEQAGYWRYSDQSVRRVGDADVNTTKHPEHVQLYECPRDACLEGGTCAEGRIGTVCAVCAEGWGRLFGQCERCPSAAGRGAVIGVTVAVFLFAWWTVAVGPVWTKRRAGLTGSSSAKCFEWVLGDPKLFGVLKMQISTFQIIAAFLAATNRKIIAEATIAVGFLSFDIVNVYGVQCYFHGHIERLVLAVVSSLSIGVFLVAPTLLHALISGGWNAASRFTLVKTTLGWWFIAFAPISRLAMQALRCRSIGDAHLMVADYTSDCPWSARGFSLLFPLLCILVFAAGVPLLFLAALLSNRVPKLARDTMFRAYAGELLHFCETFSDDAAASAEDSAINVYAGSMCTSFSASPDTTVRGVRDRFGSGSPDLPPSPARPLLRLPASPRCLRVPGLHKDEDEHYVKRRRTDSIRDALMGQGDVEPRVLHGALKRLLRIYLETTEPGRRATLDLDNMTTAQQQASITTTVKALQNEGWLQAAHTIITWGSELEDAARDGRMGNMIFFVRLYKVQFWYQEVVEMVRRVVMTSALSVLVASDTGVAAAGVLLSLANLAYHAVCTPYSCRMLQNTSFSLTIMELTAFLGLLVQDASPPGEFQGLWLWNPIVLSVCVGCVLLGPYVYLVLRPGPRRRQKDKDEEEDDEEEESFQDGLTSNVRSSARSDAIGEGPASRWSVELPNLLPREMGAVRRASDLMLPLPAEPPARQHTHAD